MARDETAREHDSRRSLLDRRSHSRLSGAPAATVAGTGATASARWTGDETNATPAGDALSIGPGAIVRFDYSGSAFVEVQDVLQ